MELKIDKNKMPSPLFNIYYHFIDIPLQPILWFFILIIRKLRIIFLENNHRGFIVMILAWIKLVIW